MSMGGVEFRIFLHHHLERPLHLLHIYYTFYDTELSLSSYKLIAHFYFLENIEYILIVILTIFSPISIICIISGSF